MVLRRVLLGGLPALLTGCASLQAPGYNLPPLPTTPSGPYRLGPGDVLNIRIYDQSQMSGTYHIDDSGFIDLPLLGPVHAGGGSAEALSRRISTALQAQKLILRPSVAIEVSTYRPFYILGEVTTPASTHTGLACQSSPECPSPVGSPTGRKPLMWASRATLAAKLPNTARQLPQWCSRVMSSQSFSAASRAG